MEEVIVIVVYLFFMYVRRILDFKCAPITIFYLEMNTRTGFILYYIL